MSDLLAVKHQSDVGKWCFLTDKLCRGQLVMAQEARPQGMRMVSAGLVPYDEYRLATEDEIEQRMSR